MWQIVDIVNEMSPYLLLGFLLAGIMHAFIPGKAYSRYLSGRNLRSVLYAALFGIPLPLCSCGVIPTAMSLRREGASKGAATSFLIATPQTGVDSIIATFSLMGLPFAIIRPIAALVTAVFGGWMVNRFDTDREEAVAATADDHADNRPRGFLRRCLSALDYAFVDMMADIGKWLVIGLVVAGLITVLVPDSFFAVFADNSLLSMLLVMLLAIPMYLCATGSIPIAVALMMKGLTPGAGLVLLMAGPASNVASILVIRKVLGNRTQIVYLASIILGAVAFGLAIDHLLPREWFTSALVMRDACCDEGASWFSWLSTALLTLMLINALVIRPLLHKESCHCHDGHCSSHANCDHDHTEVFIVKGMN
ncbi:MAG: permease, partial [Bacteroidaceae bacterium]|nr:permease [Bacteroidaceae bacterium]